MFGGSEKKVLKGCRFRLDEDIKAGVSVGCLPQHSSGIFLTVFQPLLPEQFPNRFHLSDSHNYTINNPLSVIQCIEKQLILHNKAYLVSRIMCN
jgi:hypothetical protein